MKNLILAATLVCALGTSSPVSSTNGATASETRAEYIKKAHAELDELSDKIDALELKAKAAGSEAREGMDHKLAGLKARRKTAQKAFAKLQHAGGKAWMSFTAGVDNGIRELKTAYDEAVKD